MSVGSTELTIGVGSTEPAQAEAAASPTPEQYERRRRLCRRRERA